MRCDKSAKGLRLGKIHKDGSRHGVQCRCLHATISCFFNNGAPCNCAFFIISPENRPSLVWFSQKRKPGEDSVHHWSSVLQAGPWGFQIRDSTDARCSHPNSLGEKRSWDTLNAFQITPNNILASSEQLFKAWNVTNFNSVSQEAGN